MNCSMLIRRDKLHKNQMCALVLILKLKHCSLNQSPRFCGQLLVYGEVRGHTAASKVHDTAMQAWPTLQGPSNQVVHVLLYFEGTNFYIQYSKGKKNIQYSKGKKNPPFCFNKPYMFYLLIAQNVHTILLYIKPIFILA